MIEKAPIALSFKEGESVDRQVRLKYYRNALAAFLTHRIVKKEKDRASGNSPE
jgi:hypothetical protein